MNLDKRNSYTSKSILSILQSTDVHIKSPISTIDDYTIPSVVLVILSILSLWAIGFYSILAICYYIHSGILIEDLQISLIHNENDLSKQYSQLTYHCCFSVILYSILFLLCFLILNYRKYNYLPRSDIIKP